MALSVCEFEGNLLSKAECEKTENEYEREGKAVYILEVIIIRSLYTFQRKRNLMITLLTGTWLLLRPNSMPQCCGQVHQPCRKRSQYQPPIDARGKKRIGFVAEKDMVPGRSCSLTMEIGISI